MCLKGITHMADTQASKPAFDSYPEDIRETVKSLHETLETTIRALSAIRADIEAGTYTRHAAAEDFETLTQTDGIDVFSTLNELAENESLHW